jgi:transposase
MERKDPNSMVNLIAAEKRLEERREELREQMRKTEKKQTEEKPGDLREAERQKIVMEYKEGKSITAIAQKHYLNVVAIRDILEQHGVRRRQRGHSASARPGLHDQALRMYERGNSYARIAQELGIHITTARKWIKAAKQQGEDPSLRSGCAREAR